MPPETRVVRLFLNGELFEGAVDPRKLLADFIRDDARLTGTHLGCEHGVCGACTILLDGHTVRSCLMFAVQVDGARVTTVEGLTDDKELSDLQSAFTQWHALQCGFCTPGMLLTATELLEGADGSLTDSDVREALGGNLCRCTGYQNVINAVLDVASRRRSNASRSPAAKGNAPLEDDLRITAGET